MATTVTPQQTVTLTVNPKLVTLVKSYVTWETGIAAQRRDKLNSIEEMLKAEAARGIGKGALQDALLAGGMDPQTISKMLVLAFPKGDDAKVEMEKLEKHNQTAQKGEKIDFNEKLQIARGKATVAEVLQKKQDKATGKRDARPEGNKSTTPATTAGVKETVDLKQWSFRFASLVTLGLQNKLSIEQMQDEATEVLASAEEKAEKKK